ncbi:tetratricopeptide repeat protein [Rhodoferax sp.]|uniref:tetratricopeptide repeat protein n=1 Tax=Rhodoferax sp. TaxID=50421 RepID=UPI00374DF786
MSTTALPLLPPVPPIPTRSAELAHISAEQWSAVLAAPPAQATPWVQAAARLGSAGAQAVLGQWLLDGRGLERNPMLALQNFLQAAAQDHPMGMNMAGRCLENGWGNPIDMVRAVAWYQKAAATGLDVGLYNLANQLAAGKSIAQDHAAALKLYQQAADQGHAKSMTKIGRYYEEGLVVEKDEEAAFFCYQEGARGGDFRGQFNYAGMLAARGRLAEALEWLEKVPLTATPAYLQLAGQRLLESSYPEFQRIGQRMLDTPAKALYF